MASIATKYHVDDDDDDIPVNLTVAVAAAAASCNAISKSLLTDVSSGNRANETAPVGVVRQPQDNRPHSPSAVTG